MIVPPAEFTLKQTQKGAICVVIESYVFTLNKQLPSSLFYTCESTNLGARQGHPESGCSDTTFHIPTLRTRRLEYMEFVTPIKACVKTDPTMKPLTAYTQRLATTIAEAKSSQGEQAVNEDEAISHSRSPVFPTRVR